jgi:hypothetical protein
MAKLQFGDMFFEETGDGVDIISAPNSPGRNTISTADVPMLMSFLKQHLEDSANRRSSWRLPLNTINGSDADRLNVSLQGPSETIEAKAIDISMTGMSLETREPVGERGDSLQVHVEFLGTCVTLSATIVRQDASMRRIGLLFPDSVDSMGSLTTPPEYRKIFIALEQIWLDSKLGLKWH